MLSSLNIFKSFTSVQMKTIILIHFILSCIILSYSTLIPYVLAGVVAQLFLWFYSFFPFKSLRIASTVFSSLALLSHGLLLLISTVRAWRYFFFPVKEQLAFSLECIGNIPLVVAQIVFLLQQMKVLLEEKPVRFLKNLYRNTLYIMFFHDFAYAWILAPYGGVYIFFAFTHFVVHTLMLSIDKQVTLPPFRLNAFRVLWSYLCGQHIYVMYQLWEYRIVLGFTGVYLVVCAMYLINSFLQSGRKIETKSIT